MQVPYKVDSGMTPRKLEIERRKRQYTKSAKHLEQLLRSEGVGSSSELMPVAERTSRALLGQTEDGRPFPTFPSFLPLEVFDDTEYDCRTPQEWVDMGEENGEAGRREEGEGREREINVRGYTRPNA